MKNHVMAGISASELQNRTRGQALCGWYAEAQQLASALVCAFRSLEAGATVAFLTTQLAEAAALSTWRHVADCIGGYGKRLEEQSTGGTGRTSLSLNEALLVCCVKGSVRRCSESEASHFGRELGCKAPKARRLPAILACEFTGGDKLHMRPPHHAPFQLVNIYGPATRKSAVRTEHIGVTLRPNQARRNAA